MRSTDGTRTIRTASVYGWEHMGMISRRRQRSYRRSRYPPEGSSGGEKTCRRAEQRAILQPTTYTVRLVLRFLRNKSNLLLLGRRGASTQQCRSPASFVVVSGKGMSLASWYLARRQGSPAKRWFYVSIRCRAFPATNNGLRRALRVCGRRSRAARVL